MRILGAGLLAAAMLAAGVAQAKPEAKPEPTFRRNGHIHGYLLDAAGRGITGVVTLRTDDGRIISTHSTEAFRRGRFDIDNMFPGDYVLRVESLGTQLTDLKMPEDLPVTVRKNRVIRPRLIAR